MLVLRQAAEENDGKRVQALSCESAVSYHKPTALLFSPRHVQDSHSVCVDITEALEDFAVFRGLDFSERSD